jgi:hypothetical protein
MAGKSSGEWIAKNGKHRNSETWKEKENGAGKCGIDQRVISKGEEQHTGEANSPRGLSVSQIVSVRDVQLKSEPISQCGMKCRDLMNGQDMSSLSDLRWG